MPRGRPVLLQAAARVVLVGDRGPLAGQLDRIERLPRPARAAGRRRREPAAVARRAGRDCRPTSLFANGLGGFTPDGREYCVIVPARPRPRRPPERQGRPPSRPRPVLPPAPWVNVVANPGFGFLVSEAGSGYTWAGNSQANRLTPWSNDPVSDPPGEVVYLRDEETGEVWSPDAACRSPRPQPTRRPPRPGLHRLRARTRTASTTS